MSNELTSKLADNSSLNKECDKNNCINGIHTFDKEIRLLKNLFNVDFTHENDYIIYTSRLELLNDKIKCIEYFNTKKFQIKLKVSSRYQSEGVLEVIGTEVLSNNIPYNEFIISQINKYVNSKDFKEQIKKNPHSVYIIFRWIQQNIDVLQCIFDDTKCLWSEEEQKKLELAIREYKNIEQSKEKWKKIGAYVKTKTAKQCYTRYKKINEKLANLPQQSCGDTNKELNNSKINDVKDEIKPTDKLSKEYIEEEKNFLTERELNNLIEVKQFISYYINIDVNKSENLSYFSIDELNLIEVCIKCLAKYNINVKFATIHDDNHNIYSYNVCTNCKKKIEIISNIQIRYNDNQSVQHKLLITNGTFHNIINYKLVLYCFNCNNNYTVDDYKLVNKLSCIHCFKDIILVINNMNLSNEFSKIENTKKKILTKPSVKYKFVANQPLPNNGACKHFRKSYKWFIWNCCNIPYPCDECHNKNSDHVALGFTDHIICGYCSRRIPPKSKTCICGNQIIKISTNHWEGGKGCRNRLLLSRKDNKKYKKLNN